MPTTGPEENRSPDEHSNVLDMLEHMVQQMRRDQRRVDAVKQTADDALDMSQSNRARLDALEKRLGSQDGADQIVSAVGYARLTGRDADGKAATAMGVTAARFARSIGVKPVPVQDQRWGHVNGFPVWLWRKALEGPGSVAG
jgi:hypothetical protein